MSEEYDLEPYNIDLNIDESTVWYWNKENLKELFLKRKGIYSIKKRESTGVIEDWEMPALVWLAKVLRCDSRRLYKTLEMVRRGKAYTEVIKKTKNKDRKILIPQYALKRIQHKINAEILSGLIVIPNVFGFMKGDRRKCLEIHAKSKLILKLDLVDAFYYVTRELVFQFFNEYIPETKKHWHSYYVSRILTDLTTYEYAVAPRHREVEISPWPRYCKDPDSRNSHGPYEYVCHHKRSALPQGAPTSPKLFDLIWAQYDRKLIKLAESTNSKYSRYADNVYVSFNTEYVSMSIVNAVKRIIGGGWHRSQASFPFHRFAIEDLGKSVRALGYNIQNEGIYDTKEAKRKIRMSIFLVEKSLESQDLERALKHFQVLAGQINVSNKDTLPPILIEQYKSLRKEIAKRTHLH